MSFNRSEIITKLLEAYQAFYNITDESLGCQELKALCEYYEQNEGYMVTRKANLWTAKSEEFIYLFEAEHLTMELFERLFELAYGDGRQRAHIGPGHMYTYITPIFICDSADAEAIKALKKVSIHKMFLFSFHGWLDVHTALITTRTDELFTNKSGRCMEKNMKKIIFNERGLSS